MFTFIAVLGWGLSGNASAAIIDEPMTGPAAPGWVFGGSAVLTGDGVTDPVGDGWLRLTTNTGNQGGYAFFDTPFDISQGVIIQFDYATWGGTGADGYSIFLFDGSVTPATFQLGGVGGSLGYAQRNIIPISTGLNGGYIGVGVDEWGNFQNPTEGRIGGPGQRPNSLSIRGPQSTGYAYIGGTPANVGQLWFNQPTRPGQFGAQYRKVVIYLTPVPAPNYLRIDVFLQYGYNQPLTQVLNGLMVGQPPPPTVKVGYAASTGGSTNYHEIRNLLINPLSTDINLAIFKTASLANISLGSPLTFTVAARNYGPNAVTANNVPIVDTVPAQLTGVAWTCAGTGGATCGAASGSGNNINTTATLPFNSAATYTITGTLTSAPPTSVLSNTATLTVPAGITDYDSSDDASTATVLVNTDLSTSTKTVLDLNGGDANPGDVLRYTIMVAETAGVNATGVTVNDDIPANITGFTVVSIPAGATNGSTGPPAGSNGTGYLNITNISVPANGSVTIVFEVTIAGSATPGTLIDNTAAVTPLAGTGATPSAPTVVVSESFIPQNGNKPLYLYGAAGYELSRTPTPGLPAAITIPRGGNSQTWIQSPVLQLPVTISSAVNPTVPVQLWLATNNNRNYPVEVRLACSSAPPGTFLSEPRTIPLNGTPTLFTFNLSAQPSPTFTTLDCAAGSWQLTVINNMFAGGGPARNVLVYPVDPGSGAISQAVLPSLNVINVDSAAVYDAAWPGGSPIVTAPTGATVYLRSVISDPFGSYDITGATVTITDSLGVVRVNAAAMTQVADSLTLTKTYEYAYAVPAGGPAGNWTMRVAGAEGTEGTVSDMAQTALNVYIPMPNILMLKSVIIRSDPMNGTTDPKAIPGAIALYTVTATNQGPGMADAVVVTDPVPASTELFVGDIGGPGSGPVQFTDGAVASGLSYSFGGLGSGADNVSFSNDGGTTFTYTPSPDVNGCDPAVTHVKISLTGSFNASDGTNHPSFRLEFQVRIE